MDSDSSPLKLWRRLQCLAHLFRFVELLTLLILLSWLSTRLPFAVRISGEYFSKTAVILFSPISIFLVGNAIVITLLTKSGLFSDGVTSAAVDTAVADLYRKLRSDDEDDISDGIEEVVYQDKEVIVSEEKVSLVVDNDIIDDERNVEVLPENKNDLSYRRSKSDKFKSDDSKKEKDSLRRSETDIKRKPKAELTAEEDGDCGGVEEFRRTIEAFIAKQMRFHREESLAVVIHGQA